MDNLASQPEIDGEVSDGSELRGAPRFTLLIRAAKLVTGQGEFVCVIRDVSETVVSVRLFHDLPSGENMELHLPSLRSYNVRVVWSNDGQAGFEFIDPVDVEQLINEAGEYPKRGLRLEMFIPVEVSTLTDRKEATIENLSQQGARLECDALYAIDQSLQLKGEGLDKVRAKVRWRRKNQYGLVFDDTFTLGDFARLVARLQAPYLLGSQAPAA